MGGAHECGEAALRDGQGGRVTAGRKDIEPPSISRCFVDGATSQAKFWRAIDDTDDIRDVHGDDTGVMSVPMVVAMHAGGEIFTGDTDRARTFEVPTTGCAAGAIVTDEGCICEERANN